MANEVENFERLRREGIPPERVRELIEVNETMDNMVSKVIETITPAISILPNMQVRLAFVRKLTDALGKLEEQIKREG